MKPLTENGALLDLRPQSHRSWRILELFARNGDPEEALGEILRFAAEAYALRHCAIVAPRGGKLGCVAAEGVPRAMACLLNAGDGGSVPPWGQFLSGYIDFAALPSAGTWTLAALAAGMRGCRTEPIVTEIGELLGEVTAFVEHGESPDCVDPDGLRFAARLAAIAIEQRHMMADLIHHAHHDSVTLLPNRWLLEEKLAQAVAGADDSRSGVALLRIGIDRFRVINDLLGRGVGDLLLEQAARRMEGGLRPGDTLAHTGGDEFSAVLPGQCDLEAALGAAERIRERLAAPIEVGGHELTVTASFGCALYPDQASEPLALQRCAEAALQRAKQVGRNCVRGYLHERDGSALHKARLESA